MGLLLPAVVLSFTSTRHSSTGYSPYFLAHGLVFQLVWISLCQWNHRLYRTNAQDCLTQFFRIFAFIVWSRDSRGSTMSTNMKFKPMSVEIWYGWMIPRHRERNVTLTGLDLTKLSHQIPTHSYTDTWIWDILKLDQNLFTMIDRTLIGPLGIHLQCQWTNLYLDSLWTLFPGIWHYLVHSPCTWTTWHWKGFCPCAPQFPCCGELQDESHESSHNRTNRLLRLWQFQLGRIPLAHQTCSGRVVRRPQWLLLWATLSHSKDRYGLSVNIYWDTGNVFSDY